MDQPVDDLIVPLSNGAMINGIAAAMRAFSPDMRIIVVQVDGAPAMTDTWCTDLIIETEIDAIADGIAVRVLVPESVSDMAGPIDDALLVDDAATMAAMDRLLTTSALVARPSNAISVAAVAESRLRFQGRCVATI